MAGNPKGRKAVEQVAADDRRKKAREKRIADLRLLAGPAPKRGAKDPRTLREKRIDAIVDLMVEGAWVTGTTTKLLSELWFISRSNVEQMAVEANRVIRRMIRDTPEAKQQMLARVLHTFERIASKGEGMNDARGLQVSLNATELLAEYTGLKPATKLDFEADSPFAGWTREQKMEFAATGKRPKPKDGSEG